MFEIVFTLQELLLDFEVELSCKLFGPVWQLNLGGIYYKMAL